MKNLSKNIVYIIIAIGGIAVGFAGTKLFTKKCETIYLPSETTIIYKDTCISKTLIADVTTEIFEDVSTEIKKGKPQKNISKAPVTSVEEKDSTYTTKFTKDYDFGLIKLNLKTTIKAKSAATAEHEIDWRLDTMVLNRMKTVVNTVVVSKDTIDKIPMEIVKFIPLETEKEYNSIGIGLNAIYYDNNVVLPISIEYDNGKNTFGVFKDLQEPLNSPQGYGIKYTRKFFRYEKTKQ